ncbi:MAG: sigma-70 family RNA polymerase sigma factor [Planctomycetales bacterium]|nr:sigma-70 family RNA polymerase sigma factor [Planctomycetales bacterium]
MSQSDPRPIPPKTQPADEEAVNRRTIDRLVVDHLPAALAFAQRLAGNADVAEDLVQETLCRVLRQWKSYRGQAAFKTWMFQILLNADRDRRRRQRSTDDVPQEQLTIYAPSPHQRVTAEELREQIRREIARLPDRQREVAVLTLGEGYTAAESAEILGTSVANVQTCLHLARKRIGAAIGLDDLAPK